MKALTIKEKMTKVGPILINLKIELEKERSFSLLLIVVLDHVNK